MTNATSVTYCLVGILSNHEPENGAEKCDHYARGECDPSLFLLDWVGTTTCGIVESVVASPIISQTASYLAHSEAKRFTLIYILNLLLINTPINVLVACNTLWR